MKQNSGQKATKWTAMQSLEVHVKETNQFIVKITIAYNF